MSVNESLEYSDILIFDDTASNLGLLSSLLKDAGYTVRASINPVIGLQAAYNKPPDLILLDIRMPEMNGFEVCRRIKQREETKDVPIIFVSAQNEIEDRVKGFELGGVDFICKPFQREEVLARVRTHLALRQAQIELELRVKERTAELEEQRKLMRELHNVQTQLIQSEKMASIGQLAAGVAHEVNNPIGYVYSNLAALEGYIRELMTLIDAYQVAECELPAESSAKKNIDELKAKLDLKFLEDDISCLLAESQEGISRVKKIVQDLKDFSYVDQPEWNRVDLHSCLDSTLNMVMNELKYKAEVVKEYGELPEIECIPNQLNQVFMNLLINAGQAIAGRGRVVLRTGCLDKQVFVEVSDNGMGIAAEHIKRIFEPFFTTKPIGQGTGLGLSLSYGIVKKHHGAMEVESELGKGATFRVVLPIDQTESENPA